MTTPRPIYVLSLDGGGVRGLSSLLILKRLMKMLEHTVNPRNPQVTAPCEIFDLICGTSTGGLIALMLGRLRMTVDAAIVCYAQLSEKIFGRKVLFSWFRWLRGRGIYDASILEECIKDTVSRLGHGQDLSLLDPLNGQVGCCRTFVVACRQSSRDVQPVIFRSYSTPREPADKYSIWQVARATTAASTFFDPMKLYTHPGIYETYMDGGLSGANNPSELAYDECKEIFPDREIGCFLSIGTGAPSISSFNGNIFKIAKALAKIATNCQQVEGKVADRFRRETPTGQPNPYFRFSVEKGFEKIGMDEFRKKSKLTNITAGYMDLHRNEIQRCVDILKWRKLEEGELEKRIKNLRSSPVLRQSTPGVSATVPHPGTDV